MVRVDGLKAPARRRRLLAGLAGALMLAIGIQRFESFAPRWTTSSSSRSARALS